MKRVKNKRNQLCDCGSNKKFKHCCLEIIQVKRKTSFLTKLKNFKFTNKENEKLVTVEYLRRQSCFTISAILLFFLSVFWSYLFTLFLAIVFVSILHYFSEPRLSLKSDLSANVFWEKEQIVLTIYFDQDSNLKRAEDSKGNRYTLGDLYIPKKVND